MTEKSSEELKAYQQERSKKSLRWYNRIKNDPVKWEEFKRKRRIREKARYDRIKERLNHQTSKEGKNDDGRIAQGNSEINRAIREGEEKTT